MTQRDDEPGQVPAERPVGHCRRNGCSEPVLARGLCAPHWARWQDGEDPLDMADDDRQAPPPQEWTPLPR